MQVQQGDFTTTQTIVRNERRSGPSLGSSHLDVRFRATLLDTNLLLKFAHLAPERISWDTFASSLHKRVQRIEELIPVNY